MSEHKTILENIKKLVFGEEVVTGVAEVTEEKAAFVSVSLSDGTLINIEPDVQVSAAVTVEDPEMGMVAVPDGSYELEDKRIIVVVGGLVQSVEEVAAAEEEAVEEMESETKEPVMSGAEVRKIIESVETHFNSQIAELKEVIEAFKSDAQAKNELFVSAIEDLGNEPTEKVKEKESFNGFNYKEKQTNGLEAVLNLKKKK